MRFQFSNVFVTLLWNFYAALTFRSEIHNLQSNKWNVNVIPIIQFTSQTNRKCLNHCRENAFKQLHIWNKAKRYEICRLFICQMKLAVTTAAMKHRKKKVGKENDWIALILLLNEMSWCHAKWTEWNQSSHTIIIMGRGHRYLLWPIIFYY